NKWIDEGTVRWCWLQRGGAALMLQEFRREEGESWSPEGKLGLGVSIVFICDDALEIYREATAKGIQASRPFVGNAMWLTSQRDRFFDARVSESWCVTDGGVRNLTTISEHHRREVRNYHDQRDFEDSDHPHSRPHDHPRGAPAALAGAPETDTPRHRGLPQER